MKHREMMWAKLRVDFDDGLETEKPRPYWNGFGDGDRQDYEIECDIILSPNTFPPGTKVVVSVPVCPECNLSAEHCSCGFDWNKWAYENYS